MHARSGLPPDDEPSYYSLLTNAKPLAYDADEEMSSLVPRPFVGEMAWQLTRVQTVYGYDVKEITAAPVQAMNIGLYM